jgi:curved DNA-binding protein
MQFPDFYQTLGVARGETPENIKKAYRKLARRHHPDISKEKGAERWMKELSEADEVISNSQKLAEYLALPDSSTRRPCGGFYGASAGEKRKGGVDGFHDFGDDLNRFHLFQSGDARPGFEGFGGIGDLFEEIFGRSNTTHEAPSARAARDDASRATIKLLIEDAFTGAQCEITLRLPYRDTANRSRSCQRRLKVNIPAGVHDGKHIRLAGQGAPKADGEAGDILLKVRFRPHPKMHAVKRDFSKATYEYHPVE